MPCLFLLQSFRHWRLRSSTTLAAATVRGRRARRRRSKHERRSSAPVPPTSLLGTRQSQEPSPRCLTSPLKTKPHLIAVGNAMLAPFETNIFWSAWSSPSATHLGELCCCHKEAAAAHGCAPSLQRQSSRWRLSGFKSPYVAGSDGLFLLPKARALVAHAVPPGTHSATTWPPATGRACSSDARGQSRRCGHASRARPEPVSASRCCYEMPASALTPATIVK